jgi:hypothetical protein
MPRNWMNGFFNQAASLPILWCCRDIKPAQFSLRQ